MRVWILTWLSLPAWAGTLVLEIDGFDSAQGKVLVAVYDEAHARVFPSDSEVAVHKAMVSVGAPRTVVTFEGVAPGRYAAVAVHDENGNGSLDVAAVIPIPREPIGASRDAKGFMGPPKFRDAVFEVGEGRTVERFSVARVGG